MSKFDDDLKVKLKSYMPSYEEIPWEDMEAIFKKVEYKKKDHFIMEHSKEDKLAIIAQGLFRIYVYDSKGEEKTHSFIAEGGACLNHFWIYDREPSPVYIQAVEDAITYETSSKSMDELLKKHRCFEELYRTLLIKNFMWKLKREMFFVMYDASERLEKLDEFPFVDLERIPKGQLASYLGIKPQSLSRIIKDKK